MRRIAKYLERLVSCVAALSVLTLLGCSGGGSSGSTVAPPVTPTAIDGAISVVATPSNGTSNVKRDATYDVVYSVTAGNYSATAPLLTCPTTKGIAFTLASTTVTASGTKLSFTVSPQPGYSENCIFSGSSIATGTNGGKQATATWNSALSYESKLSFIRTYEIWSGSQIYSVTKTNVTLLTNKTSFTTGFFPLANCWLPKSSGPLADGKILVACQDATSLRRHYLYINPVTGTDLYEYTGTVPSALACTENADKTWTCPANTDWISSQSGLAPAGAPADANIAIQVGNEWFFSTNLDARTTFYKDQAGNISTVRMGVAGTDGVVKLFVSFTY